MHATVCFHYKIAVHTLHFAVQSSASSTSRDSLLQPAMAMADCYYVREQQLEYAVVQRLLPPEILVEIGIADHAAHDAVVEELAARLVGILGLSTSAPAGGMGEKKRGAAAAPPPPTNAATHAHRSHVRHEQHLAGGGVINGGMVLRHHAAPVFATKQWPPPPPRPTFVAPPASFAGTGVFLPRTEVYQTRTSNPPRINGAKPPRLLRKEAAMETVRNRISS